MIPQYLAQYYDGYRNMMGDGDYVWGLLMMLLWVLIVAAIVIFVVRSTHHHDVGNGGSSDALEIAKKRYAKGEITKDEYGQLKKDLS